MTDKEINALINLLDDPDIEVVNAVKDELMKHGFEAIPRLEKAWESTLNEQLQEKLENVIHFIQYRTTKKHLIKWSKSGAEDLLEGSCYVAQFQFPEVNYDNLNAALEDIKEDVWLEITNNLTAIEKVKVLNYVIFELHKFTRNSSNFYSPQNSYINQVIELKKGNPISLAIIYLCIANKLNLPIYGVNLPKNFILAYKDEYRHFDSSNEMNDILFYINPYNKGAILSKREIDYFIKQQKLTPHKSFYIPCSNLDIIKRLLNNLIVSYEKLGFDDKIRRLKQILESM